MKKVPWKITKKSLAWIVLVILILASAITVAFIFATSKSKSDGQTVTEQLTSKPLWMKNWNTPWPSLSHQRVKIEINRVDYHKELNKIVDLNQYREGSSEFTTENEKYEKVMKELVEKIRKNNLSKILTSSPLHYSYSVNYQRIHLKLLFLKNSQIVNYDEIDFFI